MAKARKSGVKRDSKDRIAWADRADNPEKVMAPALAQPHRKGEVSQHAGTPQGRALLRWRQGDKVTGISQSQFEAAEIFARRRRAYLMVVTASWPKFGSIIDVMVAGASGGSEPDSEAIAKVRSDHREIMDALADGNMAIMLNPMTDAFAMEQEPPERAWSAFRPALNCIAVRLKINADDTSVVSQFEKRVRS